MERIIDEFLELVKIPSPSGGEREMADVLKKKLKGLGLSAREDGAGAGFGGNAGNLLAVLPASPGMENREAVLFSAHMDRVPNGDEIRPVFTGDGRLTSDGTTILAADDLAGVCAVLDGLRRVREKNVPHGRVEILFTVSEELGLRGAKNFDYSQLCAKHGYCLDSSGRLGRVVTAAPAIDKLHIRVSGKSAHAGASPEKGINAIRAAAAFLAGVRDGRLDEESTANYGIVRAGKATNVICDLAEITGEARSRDPAKLRAYEEYAENFLKESVRVFGAQAQLRVEENHGAFRVPAEDRSVVLACRALKNLGIAPYPEAGGGGMDANLMNGHGIAAVGIATGYEKNHTEQEELFLQDLRMSGALTEELIRLWAAPCEQDEIQKKETWLP